MKTIQLNDAFTFAVEAHNGKLRFVVYEHNSEVVCRIERRKAIELFLQSTTASIFKGRLQLHKQNHEIAVEVKGEVIGSMQLSSFQQMLRFA